MQEQPSLSPRKRGKHLLRVLLLLLLRRRDIDTRKGERENFGQRTSLHDRACAYRRGEGGGGLYRDRHLDARR